MTLYDVLTNNSDFNAVDDQYRMPVFADDIAKTVIKCINDKKFGIYHLAGPELFSVYEIAQKTAEVFQLNKERIHPILTAYLNEPAKRPMRTAFDISKAYKDLNFIPTPLTKGLEIIKHQINNTK